jgi:hypothetical protein
MKSFSLRHADCVYTEPNSESKAPRVQIGAALDLAQIPGQSTTQSHVPSPFSVLPVVAIFFVLADGLMAGTGMYLPWWHFQLCEPVYDNCGPYIPATQSTDLTAVVLFIPVVSALTSAAFSFLLLIRPGWRARSALVEWSLVLGALTLISAFFVTGLIALLGVTANFMQVISKILDAGYFLTLVGLSLLLPGATILLVAQSRWREAAIGATVAPAGAYHPRRFSSAFLREVLLPGAGAAYVGRPSIALGWWLGTFLGGLLVCILVFVSVNTIDGIGISGTLNPIPVYVIVGILVTLLGGWLAARIWAVQDWVRADNAAHGSGTDRATERRQEGAWDRGRIVSGAAAAIGAAMVLLTLGSLTFPTSPFSPLIMAAELISLAFWLGLVFLWQSGTSLAALGRVLLLVAALAVIIVAASLALAMLVVPQYSIPYLNPTNFSKRTLTFVIVTSFMLPLFVAILGGYGSALFSANWPAARAETRGRAHVDLVGLLPIAGILTFLPAALLDRYNDNANLVIVYYILLPFAGFLWIVGTAAVACWRRAQAQLSLSPRRDLEHGLPLN